MKKRDELNDPASCLNRARDDELVFTLLGRDRAAADTVRFWVQERIRLGLNAPGCIQLTSALEWADAVEKAHKGKS